MFHFHILWQLAIKEVTFFKFGVFYFDICKVAFIEVDVGETAVFECCAIENGAGNCDVINDLIGYCGPGKCHVRVSENRAAFVL